jgi:hypothetical protein
VGAQRNSLINTTRSSDLSGTLQQLPADVGVKEARIKIRRVLSTSEN